MPLVLVADVDVQPVMARLDQPARNADPPARGCRDQIVNGGEHVTDTDRYIDVAAFDRVQVWFGGVGQRPGQGCFFREWHRGDGALRFRVAHRGRGRFWPVLAARPCYSVHYQAFPFGTVGGWPPTAQSAREKTSSIEPTPGTVINLSAY